MKQYSRIVLRWCTLLMLTLLLFSSIGCATIPRTLIMERDTLYVERVVERQSVVRDTVETLSRMIEYVVDSSGGWQPQKMVEETSLQRHVQKSDEQECVDETSQTNAKVEIVKEEAVKREWHLFLLLSVVLLFVFLRMRL